MKLLAFFFSALLAGATALTGSLKLPNGTGATGTLVMSLAQQGALVSTGGCGGPAEIVPTYQVRITVTAGALIGSPTLYGNDCMNPQGTYYNVQFLDANANVLFTDRWQISGSSIDIGTIVSVTIQGTTQTLGSTGVVLFNPTGNQVVNQPPGSALSVNFAAVTGTFTFPSGATCDAAGCTGLSQGDVTLTTAQNIIGQKTFFATLLFAPSVDLGSTLSAATNAYVSNAVVAGNLRMTYGGLGSGDFFNWAMPAVNQLRLTNSVGTPVIQVINFSAIPNITLAGTVDTGVGDGLGFVITSLNHDINCSGMGDGLSAFRNDVSPKQIQICYAGSRYIWLSQ